MGSRLDLHEILVIALGSRYVYFQPPASVVMKYPCLVYSRDNANAKHASDALYDYTTRYQVTVIDKDPDSAILEKIIRLPLCAFDRHFTADNLNHDIYNLFY